MEPIRVYDLRKRKLDGTENPRKKAKYKIESEKYDKEEEKYDDDEEEEEEEDEDEEEEEEEEGELIESDYSHDDIDDNEFIDDEINDLLPSFFKLFDNTWKKDIDADKLQKYEEEYDILKNELKQEFPTVKTILDAKISKEKKKLAFNWLNILNRGCEPFSEGELRAIQVIQGIIRENTSSLTEEERKEMDKEIDMLKTVDVGLPMQEKIFQLETSQYNKKVLYEKYQELQTLEESSSSYSGVLNWLYWALKLPYDKCQSSEEMPALSDIYKTLDKQLYGMTNVKERICELMNEFKFCSKRGKILSLVGPPGTGKTAIGYALGEALHRPVHKVSLGGCQDPDIIRGSAAVWIEALPSIVLQHLESSDTIIILDEIDKLTGDKGMQVQNALLELLDYNHNHSFKDGFLTKLKHNLSNVIFICTMNNTDTLIDPLYDRIKYQTIRVKPYSKKEKKEIIQHYILPRCLRDMNLFENDITITHEAIDSLFYLMGTEEETGLRDVEITMHMLVSKINLLVNGDKNLHLSYAKDYPSLSYPVKINGNMIKKLWNRDDKRLEGWKIMFV